MLGSRETLELRLLLDTEAILRLDTLGLPGVGSQARDLIRDPENDLLLSSVSITEMAIKTAIGKLAVSMDLVQEIQADLRLVYLPYENRHARHLFDLPLHHRDPFDRMLIATALEENCPVVSSDAEFRKYEGLRVIW